MKLINRFKIIRDQYVINQVKNITLPAFPATTAVRVKAIFYGRVQNVGFRLEISELANRMELSGWVKNRIDKNVEAELQGEPEKIDFLIRFMKSLKRACVQEISILEIPVTECQSQFTIIRD